MLHMLKDEGISGVLDPPDDEEGQCFVLRVIHSPSAKT